MSRHRILVGAIISLLATPLLAACGGQSQGSDTSPARPSHTGAPLVDNRNSQAGRNSGGAAGDDQSGQGVQGSSLVTGTVYWPDGVPAANATIDFYPNDYPYGGTSGGGGEFTGSTDSEGRYSITGCGCTALG